MEKQLKKLKGVTPACKRPWQNHILVEHKKGRAWVTDGHQLYITDIPKSDKAPEVLNKKTFRPSNAILPTDFPDIDNIQDCEPTNKVVVDTKAMKHALKRAAICTDADHKGVTLTVNGNIQVSAEIPDFVNMTETLEYKFASGEFEFIYNVGYFRKALQKMGKAVVLNFSNGGIMTMADKGVKILIMNMEKDQK